MRAGKTALQVVSEQAPRPPPPTAGALVDGEMPAQPAEVAALLRELASGNAQASNIGREQVIVRNWVYVAGGVAVAGAEPRPIS